MDWRTVWDQFKQTWLTTLLSLVLFSGVTYFLIWSEVSMFYFLIKLNNEYI